jgi:hypothetical protein
VPRVEKDRRDLALYLVAAAIYITIGVFLLEFMLASVVALGYLLIAVWIVPAVYRRLR